MRRLVSVLSLTPLALFAQAPAPAPTPTPAPASAPQAASAPAAQPAPSLAQVYGAQHAALEALTKTDPDAALAQIEALLPAQAPAFDKTDVSTAQKSINEYDALTKLYAMAAQAANASGQWEKSEDFATKAKATAQANYDNAQAPLKAFQDTWKKAQDEAQKSLDEMATLAKVEKPTADQTARLGFLKQNEAVFQGNVTHGQQMVSLVDRNLDALKGTATDYDPFITSMAARLKNEADNIEKFKGDKKAFASAALESADVYKDKDAELTYVRRLHVLSPDDKKIEHKLNVLLGKEKDVPVKKSTKHTTRGKKKGH
ncbi:MAG TPA: hypothetical protein VFT46_11415 [Holophagaceae bacterium]|nr:hypothetical protein [Holophagaceae bacterium]